MGEREGGHQGDRILCLVKYFHGHLLVPDLMSPLVGSDGTADLGECFVPMIEGMPSSVAMRNL